MVADFILARLAPEVPLEDLALAALTRNPDATMGDLAKIAGCNRTSLYRMNRLRYLRTMLRYRLPRGEVDPETGSLEAEL